MAAGPPTARARLLSLSAQRPAVAGNQRLSGEKVALVGIFVILLLGILYIGSKIFLPITAALIAGLLFGPWQARLERLGLPPFVAALAITGGVVFCVGGVARLLVLPFHSWMDRLPQIWEALRHQLEGLRALLLSMQTVTEAVQESTGLGGGGPDAGVSVNAPAILGELVVSVPSFLGQVALFIGVLFFYLAGRARLRVQLLSLCMDRRTRLKTARILQDCERAISSYVGVITVINFGVGALTAVAVWYYGIPNAAFWGVVAAVLNYIPYIGPALFAVILLGVGLMEGGHGLTPALPALTYVGIHALEGNLVTPTLLGRHMTIEPVLVVISLALWLWLWGPFGAFLAVPILLVLNAVVMRLAGRRPAPPIAGLPVGPRGAQASRATHRA